MEWDSYLKNNSRGHCQQVSHYLKSFSKYPFCDYDLLIVRNSKGYIIGGIGFIIIGIPYFKILFAPNGPIISKGSEFIFSDVVENSIKRGKRIKAFYCQIKAPILKDINSDYEKFALVDISEDGAYYKGEKGSQIDFLTATNGFKAIRLGNDQHSYDRLSESFNTNTKRNIRKAYSNELELRFVTSIQEVKEAYQIVEQVAGIQKYKVRSWTKMRSFLMNMIANDLCIVPCCYVNGEMQGVLIVFDIGQRFNYVYGGILRSSPDLRIGHFLHNEMIKHSIQKGYACYDFGLAGNVGINRFKDGFGAMNIEFEDSRYWIINGFKMQLFLFLNKARYLLTNSLSNLKLVTGNIIKTK
ncbi:GNAT family N-acetyltransferase [Carboxylicivirga sp. RSCT41]|uniref:GNAT family N-acetyltransferase n=1 Tax=Carboxylicivirga agarovorans TaxID=3417570 RepID=UPI003D34B48C